MEEVTIRIAGANGDGVELGGLLLAKTFAKAGFNVFGFRGYQSVIRWGHVWYQVRASTSKVYSEGNSIDILIALNEDAITYQARLLNPNGVVIYDGSKVSIDKEKLPGASIKLVSVPLLDIAVKSGGDPIMRNAAAIGAVLKAIGFDIRFFNDVVRQQFASKGEAIESEDINAAALGYAASMPIMQLSGTAGKPKYLLDGNTALAIGAFASGCKFYAAYPMTPASTIMQWFAEHEHEGVLFKQTEDEITAINMTIGASSAGVRAMCGTSGGGFSLMVEGLGLAGMLEVPIVIVESQRGGPSTGLPTKTEQGDLLFVMHASQGDFPRIVLAPRSVEECFYMASDAFNLAERYQCPVIILLDLFLSEHVETIDAFNLDAISIDRGKIASASADAKFKRYAITDDGISPRSIIGTPGLEFVAASDEHNEYGELISDVFVGIDGYTDQRKRMHEKRMKKIDTMLAREKAFMPNIANPNADYFFVTFGSSTEAALEAASMLSSKGMNFGVISFNYLMPLDKAKTKSMLLGRKLIDVECNYSAQLAQVIESNTGIEIRNKILEYSGEAISSNHIAEKAVEIIKASRW